MKHCRNWIHIKEHQPQKNQMVFILSSYNSEFLPNKVRVFYARYIGMDHTAQCGFFSICGAVLNEEYWYPAPALPPIPHKLLKDTLLCVECGWYGSDLDVLLHNTCYCPQCHATEEKLKPCSYTEFLNISHKDRLKYVFRKITLYGLLRRKNLKNTILCFVWQIKNMLKKIFSRKELFL